MILITILTIITKIEPSLTLYSGDNIDVLRVELDAVVPAVIEY